MDGSAPTRVTGDYDLSGFEVSPTGDAILVWADRPVGATSLDGVAPAPPGPGSGRVYEHLFVRHWNRWSDGLRSQLFVIPMRNGQATGGGRGIAPQLLGDVPSKPGGGSDEIAWSADGHSVFFALRQAGRIEPLSENFDLFEAAADGTTPASDLTPRNKAIDTHPTTSPDGRWLAWTATARPGYENDRHVVWLRDLATGKVRSLTERWDRSVDSLRWASDCTPKVAGVIAQIAIPPSAGPCLQHHRHRLLWSSTVPSVRGSSRTQSRWVPQSPPP